MNVLFHVDQSTLWPMVTANVKNMLDYGKAEGISFTIEVVANGEAVTDLSLEAPWLPRLQALAEDGVRVAACENALRAHGVKKEDLHGFVTTVPAGVVELALKQQEGYAYIKP
ncbi:DsrE family protein [Proteiniclasticum sp. BAD-10]|uniref:DsrE family protein n=1 Tax=Proteiniclasticum sediminis TaxID=2804028 RepID=A0A941CQR8_9CLOT|nr:DsrE family protein [Proteiniclasticum sediminis]MBR0577186.1 DsrE family protein [Proteiniclasticum sediminis]